MTNPHHESAETTELQLAAILRAYDDLVAETVRAEHNACPCTRLLRRLALWLGRPRSVRLAERHLRDAIDLVHTQRGFQ